MHPQERRQLLAAHVASSGVWLGALTAALQVPDATVLIVVLTPAASTSLITGIALTSRMWQLRWVRAKAVIGISVGATGAAVACTAATGAPVTVLRAIGALALTAATVIAVTKPGARTRRPRHRRSGLVGSYMLRVLDRAARTALQVFLGYLVAAHTIGGVDWRTAILAGVLAIAVCLLQGLVDLPQVTFLGVWGDILGRATRTAAQVALGSVGANVILITDVPWATVLSAAGLAAVTSIVTSLIALPIGPAEVKGTPEIVPGATRMAGTVVPAT